MTMTTTPPTVLRGRQWAFPEAVESYLDNGLRVLIYHTPGQYVVAASLVLDVALEAEPRDREGVAELAGRCLIRGAAELDAEDFADALARCGADLGAGASSDVFGLHLSAPVTRLEPALALMVDAATAPRLDPDEFAHEKRLRLQEIQQARAYPQHVANEELNHALFPESRAGRPQGGTTATVEQVGVDDVVDYWHTNGSTAGASLVMSGDFGSLDPIMLAERAGFGRWRRDPRGPSASTMTRPEATSTPSLLLVDWPDAPQATLRIGGRGVSRADERWPALFVANHAVGGSFSSRLNTVLREEQGVTYGVSSGLDSARGVGVLTVATAVRSDAGADSAAEIVSLLAAARDDISTGEVETAVQATTDSAALGFERAEAVVARIEMVLSHGLPLDHVDENLERIRAVTAERANAAYTDVVDPASLSVVVVGDAAQLRDPLGAWGHAELREITPAQR